MKTVIEAQRIEDLEYMEYKEFLSRMIDVLRNPVKFEKIKRVVFKEDSGDPQVVYHPTYVHEENEIE